MRERQRLIEFEPEEPLLEQGEPVPQVYRIVDGRVDLFWRVKETELTLGSLGPDQFVGGLEAVVGIPARTTVVAAVPTSVVPLHRTAFLELLATHPPLLIQWLVAEARLWQEASQGIEETIGMALQLAQQSMLGEGQASKSPLSSGMQELGGKRKEGWVVRIRSMESPGRRRIRAVDLEVKKFPFFIGRAELAYPGKSENDLSLPDFLPFQISVRHCMIEQDQEGIWIRDRGSRLGTIVNGQRLGLITGVFRARLFPGRNELILGDPDSPFRFEVWVEER